ncbi:MAG TPA: carboxymuconolactone decarboxylase family protein [Sphingobium sp.]|nr:carboxymuconolactone decarboxylase family protein [Sphingobium sp.]
MVTIKLPEGDGSERERLWSLHPELGAAADHFNDVVQNGSILSVPEQEAARARVAHINGCEPCSTARVLDMGSHGLDESFYADVDDPARRGRYSRRERLAIEFAERFAAGKDAFDESFWTELQDAFADKEIFDLAMSVAKWLALGRINAVFDLAVACPIVIRPRVAA